MSLINEALKRSESDKARNQSPYFDNLTVLMPDGDDETPPPPRPTFTAPQPPRPPRKTSRALIYALVGSMALLGVFFWARSTGEAGPGDAAAEPPDEPARPLTDGQMAAGARRTPPDASLNRHNTDSQAGANGQAGPGQAKPALRIRSDSAADAFTMAMRKLREARLAEQARDANIATSDGSSGAGGSTPLTSGGKPIAFRPAGAAGGISRDSDEGPAPTVPAEPAETSEPTETKPPASAPAKPTETPEPARTDGLDTSTLRVTAILRGSQGNVALINGGLYREGQTIQGATIVRIGAYDVELTYKGKKYTIRI